MLPLLSLEATARHLPEHKGLAVLALRFSRNPLPHIGQMKIVSVWAGCTLTGRDAGLDATVTMTDL